MKLPVTTTEIQSRYFDTDAMGHISSNAYTQYMELGRADLFIAMADVGEEVPHSVVVNLNIDYVSEVIYGEAISVISWCSRVGNRSMTINNEIMAGDRIAAKASVTLVGFDPQTRRSCVLPAHWQPSEHQHEL